MSKDPYCLYYRLQILKRALPKVIVKVRHVKYVSSGTNKRYSNPTFFLFFFLYIKGIQTVTRAVISEGKGGKKLLLVEGYGLREVMTTEGKLIVNFI
jgi:hypothetical protein